MKYIKTFESSDIKLYRESNKSEFLEREKVSISAKSIDFISSLLSNIKIVNNLPNYPGIDYCLVKYGPDGYNNLILELVDEWFFVQIKPRYGKIHNGYYSNSIQHFICDQLDGLSQFLTDYSEHFTWKD